jgi:osmotically-inducible protein OsmY
MAPKLSLAQAVKAAAAVDRDDSLTAFLARQAQAVLSRSRIFDLRQLDVDHERDCVVLRGSVNSFYHKQLAQELVKAALDGVEVVNDIRVDYSREYSESQRDWF